MENQYKKNVNSIDAVIQTLYDVIGGEKGEKRDWDLFRYLFFEGAKLVLYEKDLEGIIRPRYLTPDDYVNTIGDWLENKRTTDFFENEIHKNIDIFGPIAHAWSAYESFHSKADKDPYMRGINSFQLVFHDERWWIVNLYWTRETPSNPIPEKYLGK